MPTLPFPGSPQIWGTKILYIYITYILHSLVPYGWHISKPTLFPQLIVNTITLPQTLPGSYGKSQSHCQASIHLQIFHPEVLLRFLTLTPQQSLANPMSLSH